MGTSSDLDPHYGAALNAAAYQTDIPLFEFLLSRGADINQSQALHNVACIKDPARKEEMKKMMRYLITEHGLDVNGEDGSEKRGVFRRGKPISHAAEVGSSQAIEALIELGSVHSGMYHSKCK